MHALGREIHINARSISFVTEAVIICIYKINVFLTSRAICIAVHNNATMYASMHITPSDEYV